MGILFDWAHYSNLPAFVLGRIATYHSFGFNRLIPVVQEKLL
jgi:hypothetical protein